MACQYPPSFMAAHQEGQSSWNDGGGVDKVSTAIADWCQNDEIIVSCNPPTAASPTELFGVKVTPPDLEVRNL